MNLSVSLAHVCRKSEGWLSQVCFFPHGPFQVRSDWRSFLIADSRTGVDSSMSPVEEHTSCALGSEGGDHKFGEASSGFGFGPTLPQPCLRAQPKTRSSASKVTRLVLRPLATSSAGPFAVPTSTSSLVCTVMDSLASSSLARPLHPARSSPTACLDPPTL